MTPHKQTVIDDNIGNCFSTCIACLLDVLVEDVPNFAQIDHEAKQSGKGNRGVMNLAKKWLKDKDYRMPCMEFYDPKEPRCVDTTTLGRAYVGYDDLPLMLCGRSPRLDPEGRNRLHAVIGKCNGYGFKTIHDPHPEGTGLIGNPYGVVWVIPASSSRPPL